MYYSKQKPTILNLDFSNEGFIMDFKALLWKSFHEETVPFEELRKSVNVTLKNIHLLKQDIIELIRQPTWTKKLGKDIMERSFLRNKF